MDVVPGDQAGHGQYRAVPTTTPSLPHVTSRIRKGTLTFGPVGRTCWTIGIVGLPLFCGVFGNVPGIIFAVLWCTTIGQMAMRDIWAKDSIYVPVPRLSPERSMTTFDGKPIPTLEQYVASQSQPPPES